MKKIIVIDERAGKEIRSFPRQAQKKLAAQLTALSRDGYLQEPYAKSISSDLFEIRIKYKGEWRVLYAYMKRNRVLVLSGFHKKTQRTPSKELNKAVKRLKEYL